jgi:hypothetical protein
MLNPPFHHLELPGLASKPVDLAHQLCGFAGGNQQRQQEHETEQAQHEIDFSLDRRLYSGQRSALELPRRWCLCA